MIKGYAMDPHRRQLLRTGLSAPVLGLAGQASAEPAERLRNKAVVKAYIEATDRGDMATIEALAAPDVKWWIVSRGDFDRETVMAINRRRFDPAVARKSSIFGMAAQDDRVAVEYETATVENGEPIFIVYHHLFQVRDNHISSVREWTDPRARPPRFKLTQAVPPGLNPWPAARAGEIDEAKTRAVAEAFLAPGPTNLARELTAPGFRWWVNGRGYDDMFDFFAKLMPKMAAMGPPVAPVRYSKVISGMTVEGDRAAVLINTDVIYPTYDYINRFHCVAIVRGGKIIEMHEHTDRNASIKAGFPEI